jgi:hypothetical protein
MATHNIVVFGGDHCGPEASLKDFHWSRYRLLTWWQVVAEAVKVRDSYQELQENHLQ